MKDKALQIAKDNIEWFVSSDTPMTKKASVEFLMRIAASMYEIGTWDGRSQELKEILSKLGKQ